MRDQLRLDPRRMGGLPAPFTDLTVLGAQQPVHRGLRAQIAALIEQDRVHLTRCQVDEPFLMQHVENLCPLGRRELPRLWPGLSLIHISEPTRRTPISYAVFCLK